MDASLEAVRGAWDAFFWTPEAPLSLASFRVVFGAILFIESLGLLEHAPAIYGDRGLRPQGVAYGAIDLFRWFGGARTRLLFGIHSVVCLLLATGCFTRMAALLAFLNFASRTERNPIVFHGGDNVAKFLSFLLVFSNAGGALSLDVLLGVPEWLSGSRELAAPWALRLMQLQIAIMYWRTLVWKLRVPMWIDGTAAFRAVFENAHYRRGMPVPMFLRINALSRLSTWTVLAIEAWIPLGIWFKETRWSAIVSGIVLQLGILTLLRMKAFQWLMLASFLLFLSEPEVRAVIAFFGLA